ncbi:M23 family metallopeptidase [Leptospira fletcheri]|uniref:M23 family metallopeptidase n=1 Tax=Leptospira fletcheri TaxID=2484981 RepID=UPI001FE7BD47|nr:M23 family peptidase [Leptospira fletcheri]
MKKGFRAKPTSFRKAFALCLVVCWFFPDASFGQNLPTKNRLGTPNGNVLPIWKQLSPDVLADLGNLSFPMELETPISGSYAEYRIHHLHMGCDFKTFHTNGLYAKAPFSGYVESIAQSAKGYGVNLVLKSSSSPLKAKLAHLLDFNGIRKDLELLREALSLLSGGEFQIKFSQPSYYAKQGDSVARLGESGTGVSHLHFELHLPGGTLNPLPYLPLRGKDRKPPELLFLYVDSDDGTRLRFPLQKKEEGLFELPSDTRLSLSGAVRFRLGAYDLMTSRNKNNLFFVGVYSGQTTMYERSFRGMSYEEARNHQDIFDSNRSSLNPAVYVYNLFPSHGPSADLSSYPAGTSLDILVSASDHAGNESKIRIPIYVLASAKRKETQQKKTDFTSKDGILRIKTPAKTTYGAGQLTFQKVSNLSEIAPLPEGLVLKSQAYELESSDLSWVGEAELNWQGLKLGKKDGIYLYDPGTKRWSGLKQTGGLAYLSKLGILAVLEDNAKPTITHPYLISRHRRVPEASEEEWEERLYVLSDVGSGYAGGAEILLEGEPYPSEFDGDRKMLVLRIPKSLFSWKKRTLLQMRIKDRAGNDSGWFTDWIRLSDR